MIVSNHCINKKEGQYFSAHLSINFVCISSSCNKRKHISKRLYLETLHPVSLLTTPPQLQTPPPLPFSSRPFFKAAQWVEKSANRVQNDNTHTHMPLNPSACFKKGFPPDFTYWMSHLLCVWLWERTKGEICNLLSYWSESFERELKPKKTKDLEKWFMRETMTHSNLFLYYNFLSNLSKWMPHSKCHEGLSCLTENIEFKRLINWRSSVASTVPTCSLQLGFLWKSLPQETHRPDKLRVSGERRWQEPNKPYKSRN